MTATMQGGEQQRSEIRDGMRIDWDVPIPMDDGVVLRADVFRPLGDGRHPAVLSYGPYAKGLEFKLGYPSQWARLLEAAPEVLEGSSNRYQAWELVDPERWVPDGYACVRVDSRGAGRSPGYVDCWSPRETLDLKLAIEWAGSQPWCNGKVGLNGISYYAMNQWQVGALRPKHLAAMCIWEGSSDYYRELCRHGGILCTFLDGWYRRQVKSVQHGLGSRGPKSSVTGEPVAGPLELTDEQLAANRADLGREVLERPLIDDYYRARMPRFEDIEAPLLSAGNWGGVGLHPRGNFEGFLRAGSHDKWLEVHGDTHFTHFYSGYGIALQKRFFGHFLKGEDTGWASQPRVSLNIRHPGEHFELRAEADWPIPRTRFTPFYLDPQSRTLGNARPSASATIDYKAMGEGVTFSTPPLTEPMEVTGPVAAKLWLSSRTRDADVFLVLRVFDPAGKEVTFIGANDPRVPVAIGWLRASQRKLDPGESRPWRPWHMHDELWPLTPGVPVELDVEIWPTSIVVPVGYRLALTVLGRDYEVDGTDVARPDAPYPMKGVGPFLHDDPVDRPPEVFGGINTLHFDREHAPYVLLPVIAAE
jgi:predicted acyl esterase